MYCSVVLNVRVWVSGVELVEEVAEEEEGAVKGESYHCDRKPYGSSYSRQKNKEGPLNEEGSGVDVWA